MPHTIKQILLSNSGELESLSPFWQVSSTEKLSCESIFDLQREISISPETGQAHEFITLNARDWVMVMPFADHESVIMVSQYRHGAKKGSLEFPGGIVDPGETPEQAAVRELLEETGLTAERVEKVGVIHANPAFMNNRCHFFTALGCTRKSNELDLDSNEELMPLKIRKDEINGFIEKGYVINSMCICGCYFLNQFMKRS